MNISAVAPAIKIVCGSFTEEAYYCSNVTEMEPWGRTTSELRAGVYSSLISLENGNATKAHNSGIEGA